MDRLASRRSLMTALAGTAGLVAAGGPALGQARSRPITVFAASSMTDVLEAMGAEFARTGGAPVRFSFASSAVIARQLEAGAPADMFVSADLEWMDYVQGRGLIQTHTRANMVSNRLVLIAAADSTISLRIAQDFPIARALGPRGRLSTGDPDNVPVGRYARQALTSLGVWNDVADHLVRAENVRSAMMFVSRGEAPLGIVYQTDAMADRKVKIVDTFPTRTHQPILYPAALTAKAQPGALAFLDFVRGPRGRALFQRFGFISI